MLRLLLPLLVFLGLAGLLMVSLDTAEQRQRVDSPLIGRPMPNFTLPGLHDPEQQHAIADWRGQPYILNVWGSWCPGCREEHPYVERLGAEAGVPLIGFNWQDERESALRWLRQFGDAWHVHLVDEHGRAAIDLGVYGAPETFLVDHLGIIRHKHIGPIDQGAFDALMDRIQALRSEAEA